jgi:hypothetical protein
MRKQALRLFFGVSLSVLLAVVSAGANSGFNEWATLPFGPTVGNEEVVASILQRRASTSALLFYNAGSGIGATARLDGAGNYTFVASISRYSTDWTHIAGL